MQRRSFMKFLGLSSLTVGIAACPRPIPGPDGGGVTPSGVLSVVTSVMDTITVVKPILVVFFRRFIPEGVAKTAVLAAAAVVERIATEWTPVAQTYIDRGGDSCMLFALTGTLTDALVRLARALVDAGFGWGSEVEQLISDTGLLLDRLVGRCTPDGGADGGPNVLLGAVGNETRAMLADLRNDARNRGTALRSLPPISPDSLR